MGKKWKLLSLVNGNIRNIARLMNLAKSFGKSLRFKLHKE